MTSSVDKSSSFYSEPYIYGSNSESYTPERSMPIRVILKESLSYHSHVDRLFQKTTIHPLYIEPPSVVPEVENRLFLSDIICSYENLVSCWESYLKKIEDLPQDSSTETIRKLCEHMAELSQISREISYKRYELQKG